MLCWVFLFCDRSLRHFFSSRSTSFFGTAITRFVRFVSRSIGVLPGTVTFMARFLIAVLRCLGKSFILPPRGDGFSQVGATTTVYSGNLADGQARLDLQNRFQPESD